MGRLRRRLSYANVVSTLALVLALSGGAVYAANKIGAGGIRKGAIRSFHIKNRQVRRQDIAGGSINSRKVSNDSLTGKDIKEARLGLVPSAQDARTVSGITERVVRASLPNPSSATQVVSLGGLAATLSCPGGTATLEVRGVSPEDEGTIFDSDSGASQQFDSDTPQTVVTAGTIDPGIATLRRVDGTLTRLDFELLSLANGFGGTDDCFLNGFLISGK
jgi:hypothetical protein